MYLLPFFLVHVPFMPFATRQAQRLVDDEDIEGAWRNLANSKATGTPPRGIPRTTTSMR
jgi:hypothetical protein